VYNGGGGKPFKKPIKNKNLSALQLSVNASKSVNDKAKWF